MGELEVEVEKQRSGSFSVVAASFGVGAILGWLSANRGKVAGAAEAVAVSLTQTASPAPAWAQFSPPVAKPGVAKKASDLLVSNGINVGNWVRARKTDEDSSGYAGQMQYEEQNEKDRADALEAKLKSRR